jgi:hypothetical protein
VGKIGDLFVRLGLKSNDYKKGMNEAKKDTKSFGKTLGGMKAGAMAVWAAIGTAVVKFGKDFISATNKIGDAWAHQMAGMKAGYHTFIASLSNMKVDTSNGIGGFFKSLFGNAKETAANVKAASDAAKEMSKAFDAEFELTNSVRLQKMAIQEELNDLEVKMRDTTKSAAERMAAAKRYEDLMKPLIEAEIKTYNNMLSAAVNQWQAGTGLNRTQDEIIEFFMNIGTNAEAMIAKFPDINDIYENFKGDATNQPIFDIIAKTLGAESSLSEVRKKLGRTTNAIRAEIQRQIEEISKEVSQYGKDIELDLELDLDLSLDEAEIEAGMAEEDAAIKEFAESWNAECLKIRDMNQMLEDSLISSFSNGMQALTDFMMGVEGASAEQVLAAFIQPLADTMKQMGEMFIAEGLAMEAFKTSLTNPAALIAAGAALIAVSSMVSSGLAKLTGNPTGGTATSVGAANAGSSVGSSIETYESELTVKVVGTISGSDIILAGEKTQNKWSR